MARGDLNLLVNAQHGQGGAAQAMPDGRKPEPGGWNRIQIEVSSSLEANDGTNKRKRGWKDE